MVMKYIETMIFHFLKLTELYNQFIAKIYVW